MAFLSHNITLGISKWFSCILKYNECWSSTLIFQSFELNWKFLCVFIGLLIASRTLYIPALWSLGLKHVWTLGIECHADSFIDGGDIFEQSIGSVFPSIVRFWNIRICRGNFSQESLQRLEIVVVTSLSPYTVRRLLTSAFRQVEVRQCQLADPDP